MYDIVLIPGSQLYRTRPDIPQPWYESFLDRMPSAAMPELPVPPEQTWDRWSTQLDKALSDLRPNGLVVAHSMGGTAALLKAQELTKAGERIQWSMLLLAPLLRLPDILRPFDVPEGSNFTDFVGRDLDLAQVGSGFDGSIRLIHAGNDRILSPLSQDYAGYASQLGAELVVFESGGHFQGETAEGQLELILNESRSLLDPSLRRGVERSS